MSRNHSEKLSLLVFGTLVLLHQLLLSGERDITLLFVLREPLQWHRDLYGYFIAAKSACLSIGLLVVLPILVKFTNITDSVYVLVGLAFQICKLVILCFSSYTWMVFLSVVIGSPGIIVLSASKSAISKSVSGHQIGKTLAILSF